MEELHLYFSKPDWGPLPDSKEMAYSFRQHIETLDSWDGDWEKISIVLIGITDGCNSPGNASCALAPDAIRKSLVSLAPLTHSTRILDLGNILGKMYRERVVALRDVLSFLACKDLLVVVLGGSQDYTATICEALAVNNQPLNLVVADSRVDWSHPHGDYTSMGFLQQLVEQGNVLFDQLTLVGLQRYLNAPAIEYACKDNKFEILRLGNIRGAEMSVCEPYLRDADVVSVDVSVVKSTDMPAQKGPMPNGLWSHDICQMARYAGLSDRLKVWGLFELNPEKDTSSGEGVALSGQIVWHVLEAAGDRYGDYPKRSLEEYERFVVMLDDWELEIVFYHNPLNNRWWVRIPFDGGDRVLSCSYADYQRSIDKDIPERWLGGLFLSE